MISLLSKKSSDFYSSRITAVSVQPPKWKLDGRGMFFIGSCFAENLYREFSGAGLNALISPFGNIYNPASLSSAAGLIAAGGEIGPDDCFLHKGEYRHFMYHTLKYGADPEEFAALLNQELRETRNFLEKSEAVVITLGTAYIYRLRSSGKIVNNCHRIPSGDFSRELLSLTEAALSLKETVRALQSINPDIKIVLTLSPVRHLRDKAAENSLSKAVLRCAVNEVCRDFPDSLWYFPSCEIVLDELRDYRWYASDLCHPSDEAVSYIISRFIENAYDDHFQAFLAAWLPILRDLNHRPLNPDSEEHRRFITKIEEKKRLITAAYPDIMADIGQ